MKLRDRVAEMVCRSTNVVDLIRTHFPDYEEDGNVLCPFHDDDNPSLHIAPDGKAHCHGCGFNAQNIIDLCARVGGITYQEASKNLYDMVVGNTIPRSRVQACMKYFRDPTGIDAATYLMNERGLLPTIINAFELGLDPNTQRITIPIFDEFGVCVNIRMAAWDKKRKSRYKVINTKGHGATRIYPEWLVVREEKVLLVGGEFDVLIGRTHKLPTCCSTNGEGIWSDKNNWLFVDKAVFILYDNDEQGKRGADQAYQRLKPYVKYVEILEAPSRKGKDLTDWIKADPTVVKWLQEDIDSYKLPTLKQVRVCPYCGRSMEGVKHA